MASACCTPVGLHRRSVRRLGCFVVAAEVASTAYSRPKGDGTNRRQPELTHLGRTDRPHEPRRLPSPNVDGEAHSGRARTPTQNTGRTYYSATAGTNSARSH